MCDTDQRAQGIKDTVSRKDVTRTNEHKAGAAVGPLSSLREGPALQAGVQGRPPHLVAAAVDVGAQPPPTCRHPALAVCRGDAGCAKQVSCTAPAQWSFLGLIQKGLLYGIMKQVRPATYPD